MLRHMRFQTPWEKKKLKNAEEKRRERDRQTDRQRTYGKESCIRIIAMLHSEQQLQNAERRFPPRILDPSKLAVQYEGRGVTLSGMKSSKISLMYLRVLLKVLTKSRNRMPQ